MVMMPTLRLLRPLANKVLQERVLPISEVKPGSAVCNADATNVIPCSERGEF